jgi:hypothetical protein
MSMNQQIESFERAEEGRYQNTLHKKEVEEERQERVQEATTDFVTMLCVEFGWDYDNVERRKEIAGMIQKTF